MPVRRAAARSGVASGDAHPVERRAHALILAIDQGTTGTTCLVVDDELRAVGRGYREIRQSFPQPGWVEHDPEEIWASVEQTAAEALAGRRRRRATTSPRSGSRTSARRPSSGSGRPGGRCIPRSSGRTGGPRSAARELPPQLIRERTGLVPDPYFSATKLEWILARTDARADASSRSGRSTRGSSGSSRAAATHVTDVTNASRTMLLDLAAGAWDDELLALFGVDRAVLPEVVPLVGRRRRGDAPRRDASRSPGSPATSRRRSSGRAASRPARRRRRTGRGRSCSSPSASDAGRAGGRAADDGRGGRARAAPAVRGRGRRCSSAARRCNGSATGSA